MPRLTLLTRGTRVNYSSPRCSSLTVPDKSQNAKRPNRDIRQAIAGVSPRILRDSTREIEISRHVDDVARQADDDLRRLRDRSATLTANARAKVSRQSERVSLMRDSQSRRLHCQQILVTSRGIRQTIEPRGDGARSVTRSQLVCCMKSYTCMRGANQPRCPRIEVNSSNSRSGFCFGLVVHECDSVLFFFSFLFFSFFFFVFFFQPLHARFRARRVDDPFSSGVVR